MHIHIYNISWKLPNSEQPRTRVRAFATRCRARVPVRAVYASRLSCHLGSVSRVGWQLDAAKERRSVAARERDRLRKEEVRILKVRQKRVCAGENKGWTASRDSACSSSSSCLRWLSRSLREKSVELLTGGWNKRAPRRIRRRLCWDREEVERGVHEWPSLREEEEEEKRGESSCGGALRVGMYLLRRVYIVLRFRSAGIKRGGV